MQIEKKSIHISEVYKMKLIEAIKQIKANAKKFFLITTIHGIQNIVRSDSILIKILWLVSLLASASVCCFFLSTSIINYLKFKTVSSIDVIYEQLFQFVTSMAR